jgi:hypothetical protein
MEGVISTPSIGSCRHWLTVMYTVSYPLGKKAKQVVVGPPGYVVLKKDKS